jgi:hypothetical protein
LVRAAPLMHDARAVMLPVLEAAVSSRAWGGRFHFVDAFDYIPAHDRSFFRSHFVDCLHHEASLNQVTWTAIFSKLIGTV